MVGGGDESFRPLGVDVGARGGGGLPVARHDGYRDNRSQQHDECTDDQRESTATQRSAGRFTLRARCRARLPRLARRRFARVISGDGRPLRAVPVAKAPRDPRGVGVPASRAFWHIPLPERRWDLTALASGSGARSLQRPSRQPLVIGNRRSRPNALKLILVPGGYCRRLYSARSTIRITRSAKSGSKPIATISS